MTTMTGKASPTWLVHSSFGDKWEDSSHRTQQKSQLKVSVHLMVDLNDFSYIPGCVSI